MQRHSISIVLSLLLAGCSAGLPATRQPAAPGIDVATRLQPPADARVYEVVAGESLITVRVYRDGPLASAGHNHVIAMHAARGRAWLARELARSVVQLEFDAVDFTVDEPDLRVAAGPDFPRDVPEAARSGTRDNLRGPGVLDAAQFPVLRMEAAIAGTQGPERLRLATTLWLKGREVKLDVPLQLEHNGALLVASGEMPLRQSDLGLAPFSVMLGALRVRDEMQVSYRIVARAR